MSPPVAAVLGAVVVVLIAVAVVVVGVRGGGSAEPVPVAPRRASSTTVDAPPGRDAAAPAAVERNDGRGTPAGGAVPQATTPAPKTLLVHVVGQVAHEGVVSVPGGARVKDAIAAAGGTTRKAVLRGLNLARPVVDGEQIFVPDSADAPVPIAVGAPPGPQAGAPAPVDLNTADRAALLALPGVGEKTADKILAWRSLHGRFTSVDELGEVDGIGDKTLEKLRPLVKV